MLQSKVWASMAMVVHRCQEFQRRTAALNETDHRPSYRPSYPEQPARLPDPAGLRNQARSNAFIGKVVRSVLSGCHSHA